MLSNFSQRWFGRWFRFSNTKPHRAVASRPRGFRPRLEVLEDRTAPALLQVGAGDVPGLIAAINQANSNSQANNTIELASNSVYYLNAVNNSWYGPDGLPAISSNLTIDGNGATIERSANATPFRLFYVSDGLSNPAAMPAGQLTLVNLTLEGGLAQGGAGGSGAAGGGGAAGMGGAVFNQGSLTLIGVTLTGNSAVGGNGGNADPNIPASGGGGGLGGAGGAGDAEFGGALQSGGGGGGFAGGGAAGSGLAGGNGGSGIGSTEGGIGGTSADNGAGGTSTYGGNGASGLDQSGGGGGGFQIGDNASAAAGAGRGGLGSAGADGGSGGTSDYATGNGGGGAFGGGGGGGVESLAGGGGGVGGGGGGAGDYQGAAGGGSGGFGGGGGGSAADLGGAGGFGGGGGGGTGNPGLGGGAGGLAGGGGGGALGGALFNQGGNLLIFNSTLAGNSAQGGSGGSAAGNGQGYGGFANGGALFNLDGTVNLYSVTFAENSVTPGAGHPTISLSGTNGNDIFNGAIGNNISTGAAASAFLYLNNVILGSGTTTGPLDFVNYQSLPTNHATTQINAPSLSMQPAVNIGGTMGGAYALTVGDPLLDTLASNGGPTETIALSPKSPALGTGANLDSVFQYYGLLATDQRGVPRELSAGAGAWNIGAYQATALKMELEGLPGAITAGVSTSFIVSVSDSFGQIAVGYSDMVQFTAAGAVETPPASGMEGTGSFNVAWQAAGLRTLTVSDGILQASASVLVKPAAATQITAVAGTPQTGIDGYAFPTPLQAQVTDVYGNAIANLGVTFHVPNQGPLGTLSTDVVATTNASGIATAPPLTANDNFGSFTVTATFAGVSAPADFVLTDAPDVVTNMAIISGANQSAKVGTLFASPLMVRLTDANNRPVAHVPVSFIAPGSGAGGSFAPANTPTTDFNGIATAPAFTANDIAGAFDVTVGSPYIGTTVALTNVAGAPTTITSVGGTPQSAIAYADFAAQLQAKVTDVFGNPVPSVPVVFSSSNAGGPSGEFGAVTSAIVPTNALGIATAPTLTAGAVPGTFTESAQTAGVTNPASFSLNVQPETATTITIVAGDNESTTVGTPFAGQLLVRLTDAHNRPVVGAPVAFSAPASGASGSFTTGSGSVVSNVDGIAAAPVFTANDFAGSYGLTVGSAAVGTTLTLTNLAGVAATIAPVGGTPQSTTAYADFATPLQAKVMDQFGNPVPNVQVTFGPTSGPGGPFGDFAGLPVAPAQTNALGIATAPTLTAGAVPGTFTESAQTAGVANPASFSLNVQPETATTITIVAGDNESTTVGTPFAGQLLVRLTDAHNRPVVGAPVAFSAPASGASGSFTTGSGSVVSDVNGIATAPVFTANDFAGSYGLTVGSAAVGTTLSLTNLAGAPAAVTALAGTSQIAGAGSAIAIPLQAQVTDVFGNPVANVPVTFTVPSQGASGTFSAPATVPTNALGIATAPTLILNGTPGPFTVNATVAGVQAPAQFALADEGPIATPGYWRTVTPSGPSQLTNLPTAAAITVVAGNNQVAYVMADYATPLQVKVTTAAGAPISGIAVTFTAVPSGDADGAFTGLTTVLTDVNGIATAPRLTANGSAGAFSVRASVAGVSNPAVFTLTNSALGTISRNRSVRP